MSNENYEEFHQLVEQFNGEMSLKDICRQEGVAYRSYIAWRSKKGLCKSRKPKAPHGMVEVQVEGNPSPAAKAVNVHIEFENGLRIDRPVMEVESLVEFLIQLKPVLCLG